jgi:hypothetical protein
MSRGPLHGFYHFFTGYFIPLYAARMKNPGLKLAVVDCGPFNAWFRILPGDYPEIVDQAKSIKLAYLGARSGYARGYRVKAFVRWDKWDRFSKRPFADVSRDIRERFGGARARNTPDILVMGREHTPEYFAESEARRYGKEKRNIPNLGDVVAKLSKNLSIELLDGALVTPEEMISRCAHVRVIVGQHGAALCNAFFMAPGSHLIEIGAPYLASPDHLSMYRVLCREIGIQWRRPILQTEDHFSPINAEALRIETDAVPADK